MALHVKSPSKHNSFMGQKIPHPQSTKFHNSDDFPTPPSKRRRGLEDVNAESDVDLQYDTPTSRNHSPHTERRDEISDSEDEEESGIKGSKTQLETALPHMKTDAEAIEAYEAFKAGEGEAPDNLRNRLENRSWTKGRSSIYVDAFNLALDAVLEEEGHLFDEAEMSLFEQWRGLIYDSQYLYVRLFLRKTSAWHRIGKLGYYSDISDLEATIVDLQQERILPKIGEQLQENPGEFQPPEGTSLGDTFSFAECSSDHITTLDEASSLLLLDELKDIAKEAKVQGKNKSELLKNLRTTSGKQGGLESFRGPKRSDTIGSKASIASDSGGVYPNDEISSGASTPISLSNRDAYFTKVILNQTGRCIRLSTAPLKLFERVHLVFYRSTEWTEKSLTTLILAKVSRRNFPAYLVSRSSNIFESRSLLLEFEASLRTQFRVDNILEFNGPPGVKGLKEILTIFEAVYPRWKGLLKIEQGKEDSIYSSGEGGYLRRFSPAWVYTRIVHKSLHPMARFKDHLREHALLVELLTQRLFHAARRGAWYARKALLEEHYMFALIDPAGSSEEARKKYWKRVALRTCEEGLEDRECHVIYHFDLQKRIKKLEKQLKLPVREQHDFGHVLLSKPAERSVQGIQIKLPEPHPKLRRNSSTGEFIEPKRLSTKTIWLDELDTNEHVSVEAMCLSYYRKELGWKGYHSEGGILRTLFGLLFYDLLFHVYVPNVFQTAYQTCPLDLHSDAFYSARLPEVNARCNEIEAGGADRVLMRHWEVGFERRECVVGVRWEEYELEDLREVVRAWTPGGLSVVMRVLAQEYGGRGGGVPDLFLWRVEREDGGEGGEVMFAEVKSENDRLSDTQRLWISVLLNAGVRVELCHAVAREVRNG